MADLTTTANVQAQAGSGISTASAAVLASLITAVSAFIAELTDVSFGAVRSWGEIRSGSGGTELYLADQPVASITSLTIDGVTIPAQPADQQPGWFLADGVLCLYGYVFCRGRRNVRVSGTSGYAAVPKDVEQACIEMVVAAYKRVPRDPAVTSATQPVNGSVFSFSKDDVPPFATSILNRYRKVVPQ